MNKLFYVSKYCLYDIYCIINVDPEMISSYVEDCNECTDIPNFLFLRNNQIEIYCDINKFQIH